MLGWIRELNRTLGGRPHARARRAPRGRGRRRAGRGGARELYERSELQVRLAGAYGRAEELVPGDRVAHVDANVAIEARLSLVDRGGRRAARPMTTHMCIRWAARARAAARRRYRASFSFGRSRAAGATTRLRRAEPAVNASGSATASVLATGAPSPGGRHRHVVARSRRFFDAPRVEPLLTGGKFQGWSIVKLRAGDPLWDGGDLAPGDVVLAVSARPIERPEQALAAFQSMAVARELRVAYERDGARREIVYPIDDDAGSSRRGATRRASLSPWSSRRRIAPRESRIARGCSTLGRPARGTSTRDRTRSSRWHGGTGFG